ncbi:RNA-binding transcriptional accessory protein [candidate division KSB1 bacterium]|nr:RNA-binding transcriptional accessory protein [candidate division KSB1 bacterium]RQW06202.1 MAG: RNA-binding transcriptional accessory protein [candidate division KSB1 bacterium]
MDQQLYSIIAEELGLRWNQVKNTVELLDADNTVPFIARYRKEVTGSLDEDSIRAIWERIRYLRHMEERKQVVLKSIDAQGKLTPELEEKIKNAVRLQDVEDLYLPYKPKRRTRAAIARERGLQPLADLILGQEILEGSIEEYATPFINEEQQIHSLEDALAGARDIVAEAISDDADIRKLIRQATQHKGVLVSQARDHDDVGDFEIYKEFSETLKSIPAYRILAINRGEREDYLRVRVDVPETDMVRSIEKVCITNRKSIFTEQLEMSIADAYRRLIAPAIERELRNALTARADEHAIAVFARNLRALLLTPPLKDKKILGIDPGYRTGCKVAVIDATGKYLQGTTIYPHPPQRRWEDAKKLLQDYIDQYDVDVVAIGNGTASRETEQLVAQSIGDLDRKVYYAMVNEAGASVYSASAVAQKEFPDLDASMRGNISIARRLLDPLSELVKIDPKSIGVGLYQHDVDQADLAAALDAVVESAVNQVGVDVNTASASLLKYVAGVNSRLAENIVKFREERGIFTSREALMQVKGLGDNAFVQAAGFLRIRESDLFFDSTAVHPESYEAALALLQNLDLTIDEVRSHGARVRSRVVQDGRTLDELAQLCGCGKETLADIIDSLEKPNRDPRDDMPHVDLRGDVLSIDDLAEGMILKGTVRNVVDFGAFVDIGVKQDGLVHLSKMAKRFVKNPLDVLSVGDIVQVKVLSIDKERGRIGLSMVFENEK